ncbi:MAG: TetR/AcrR family transcriptional regulator [Rubrivivax sp.]|nr:TetR/AcrR family transcriptional regulator [Rubrivivax sp.]
MPTRRTPDTPDLRQRILDTSRALLDAEGVAALSLREVARRAGVTHQAPYHHFADREAILAELVTEGFQRLADRLAKPNDNAARDGRHATLVASGEAYVGYALDHPGVFRIMFRPDLCDQARFPAAVAAGARGHGELLRLVHLLHGAAASPALASLYWAQVHGLACLLIDGPLGQALPTRRARLAHVRETMARFADATVGQDPTRSQPLSSPAESRSSKGE